MSEEDASWHIDDEHVHLCCGPLSGRVEFASVGIHFFPERWNSTPLDELSLLFTRGPSDVFRLVLKEWYVRGTDLVAHFERTPSHHLTLALYWRAGYSREHRSVSMEMILSMQTDLLDSLPQAQVHSFSQGGQLWQTDSFSKKRFEQVRANQVGARRAGQTSPEQLFVFRNEKLGLSYAQTVHPSDFVAAEIGADEISGLWGVASKLFPERLEKGVIRRGRICGWFMPVENDLETAVALARQFANEPLPLTT